MRTGLSVACEELSCQFAVFVVIVVTAACVGVGGGIIAAAGVVVAAGVGRFGVGGGVGWRVAPGLGLRGSGGRGLLVQHLCLVLVDEGSCSAEFAIRRNLL